jgi:hypothetical protein
VAEKLSEAGRRVTQIHSTGVAKTWQWWEFGCVTHSHSDGDYVVTSDGHRHKV